jgi:hypothetical protein
LRLRGSGEVIGAMRGGVCKGFQFAHACKPRPVVVA